MKSLLIRSLTALAWLTLAGIPIALATPGCQGRECEGGVFTDYGLKPNEGHKVDANTWESTPNSTYADGTKPNWLYFGPYDVIVFHPQGLDGRDILESFVYLSADPDPNDPGHQMTLAGGNLATVTVVSTAGVPAIFVGNSTCQAGYIRAVFVADPAGPTAPLADGGTSADLDAGDSLDAADASD